MEADKLWKMDVEEILSYDRKGHVLRKTRRSNKTRSDTKGRSKTIRKVEPSRENTSISRYVWLPIEWHEDKPVIRWQDEWRL